MYPSAALLGQDKDQSIGALPVDELIEKADGFAGVFPGKNFSACLLELVAVIDLITSGLLISISHFLTHITVSVQNINMKLSRSCKRRSTLLV